ncbi:MAG TPA: M3 family oligoendopeptidase [Candidatus Kryptonia bacterium]|nr:M3 family oligoendopeptidase [Candidatus Kryptonia bacterium]
MSGNDVQAEGVAWDLSDLYRSADDPALRADLDAAAQRAAAFEQKYRGTIDVPNGPEPSWVAAAVAELEAISEQAARPAIYAGLVHAADVRPASHGALVAMTQERGTAIRNVLLFFELEWIALADEPARRVISSDACRRYRHFLESMRRYRPHTLSEPEEKLLEEKANTGGRAFARLFDEVLSSLQFDVDVDGQHQSLNESAVLALLYDAKRERRQAGARALTAGLRANSLLLTFIFNVLIQDHAVDDRVRSFRDPMASRHLANEIDAATVDALMTATEAGGDVVRDYYHLKRRLLGLDDLTDYDRYAPIFPERTSTAWPSARELVLTAYEDFSPRMREIAELFFERRWIDAEPRDGKRGGAFSASTVPSVHPYVLLNYTGRVRDVMTIAHELGHGVHQYLSRERGYFQSNTALTMAETASVFGEMLVFDRLRRQEQDPKSRLALLCGKIEDTFSTVFRQIALTRFEQRLHAARRSEGELAAHRIGEIWLQANETVYGDSVRLTDDYRWWWSYIPHFIHSPFYCYAYGFGELLVLALYEMYRREGATFVPKYLDLLAAGGSEAPATLLQRIGVDVSEPEFWQLGLRPIRGLVDEAKQIAASLTSPLSLGGKFG